MFVKWINLAQQCPVAGCCEYGFKTFGYIGGMNFLCQFND
jgi:hypothetical protein